MVSNLAMQRSVSRLGAAFFLILLSFTLTACPPKDPCDEKLQNPGPIKDLVVTSPVVNQLSQEFTLKSALVAECFVEDQTGVSLQFEIPTYYSQYHIPYILPVSVTLWKDGTIEMDDYQVILANVETGIHTIETHPQVAEFLAHMIVRQGWPVNLHLMDIVSIHGTSPSGQSGHIEIELPSRLVTAYGLPNEIDWPSFPEVEQAHKIIEENLLINDLSDCHISTVDERGGTRSQFHYQKNGPWFLTVTLICTNGRKDAFLQLNPDGSYEQLSIR